MCSVAYSHSTASWQHILRIFSSYFTCHFALTLTVREIHVCVDKLTINS